jgi:hypothetical protein
MHVLPFQKKKGAAAPTNQIDLLSMYSQPIKPYTSRKSGWRSEGRIKDQILTTTGMQMTYQLLPTATYTRNAWFQ